MTQAPHACETRHCMATQRSKTAVRCCLRGFRELGPSSMGSARCSSSPQMCVPFVALWSSALVGDAPMSSRCGNTHACGVHTVDVYAYCVRPCHAHPCPLLELQLVRTRTRVPRRNFGAQDRNATQQHTSSTRDSMQSAQTATKARRAIPTNMLEHCTTAVAAPSDGSSYNGNNETHTSPTQMRL